MGERLEGIPCFLRFEGALLDARHIQQVAYQAVETVRFVFDGLCEAAPGLIVPPHILLQERACRGLNGGEWRAQVMRDGGEEGRTQDIGAPERLQEPASPPQAPRSNRRSRLH